jgi:hypothetical protein
MLVRRVPCCGFPDRLPLSHLRLTLVMSMLLPVFAARAQAATVALVRPSQASQDVGGTLSRIYGELLAVGLTVEIVDRPSSASHVDSRTWLAEVGKARGVDAVVDIVGEALAVDVEVLDRASGTFWLARVNRDPSTDNASEKLAIRAVEVLRSRFLELDLMSRENRSVPDLPVSNEGRRLSDASPSPRRRLGVAVGAVAWTSLDGIGPAVLPLLRLDLPLLSWLAVQGALAGYGTRARFTGNGDEARMAQSYALLGACYQARSGKRLRPFVSTSLGASYASVEGSALAPRSGLSAHRWSMLGEASAGAELALGDRLYLTAAAHVHLAAPYVVIHLMNDVSATSGRPNVLLSLTLGARL